MAKGISALADTLDRNHKLWTSFWRDEPARNGKTCKRAELLIQTGPQGAFAGRASSFSRPDQLLNISA
jgi:hypothetical protein